MATQPKEAWKVQQRNRDVPFQRKFPLYIEPSDFNYAGLKKQRDGGAYDNFLRSNIDNEQDRRNFKTEPGKDHLPFRTFETAGNDASPTIKNKMKPASAQATGVTEAGDYVFVKPGEPLVMPLRWNNPHSSELEVNIWIMNKGDQKYVIPVKKPTCSGEGYQDNVFTFTIPPKFTEIASCKEKTDCVLQVYAHSVESRMYASGVPLIVDGSSGKWAAASILEAQPDPGFDLKKLRPLCLPSNDPSADITDLKIFKARLSSDVYNHAYQNSDFSPYAGQQPSAISQNLQAACILKMTVGNFGELGKAYMQQVAPEARQYADKLDKKARNKIRVYETIANAIIEGVKQDVANSTTLPSVAPPAGATLCVEWRDQYDKVKEGRKRGLDRTGGYCEKGYTCLCQQDCYMGYGPNDASGNDAYCAILEADGKVKAGSQKDRWGYSPQKTETCFRCPEVGSTVTKRHNTNTYIPSFDLEGVDVVEKAREYVAPIYLKNGFLTHPETGKITEKGDTKARLQIYMAVLSEMWEDFKSVSTGSYLQKYYKSKYDKLIKENKTMDMYKFTYRGPVMKTTTATLADSTSFKKINAAGKEDNGQYAASKAWALQDRGTGSSVAVPNTLTAAITWPPPPPADTNSCSRAAALTTAALEEADIVELGEDMDGLNADADCDNDATVKAMQAKMDDECRIAKDAAVKETPTRVYVCPPYPEPECKIPGQGGILPGQMFANTALGFDAKIDATSLVASAAPTLSSLSSLAFVLAASALALSL